MKVAVLDPSDAFIVKEVACLPIGFCRAILNCLGTNELRMDAAAYPFLSTGAPDDGARDGVRCGQLRVCELKCAPGSATGPRPSSFTGRFGSDLVP